MKMPNIIPRSSRTIAIIILVILGLFIVDQYRNKDFFGLAKPKPLAV